MQGVREKFEKAGYTALMFESSDKPILSGKEVSNQDITNGWTAEPQQVVYIMFQKYDTFCIVIDIQDSKPQLKDIITDKGTVTTFIVSSGETSPDDLSFSVTLNGGQTPHTVTVERKANKKCVCQVFYNREGINRWKTALAFCHEQFLEVSLQLTIATYCTMFGYIKGTVSCVIP